MPDTLWSHWHAHPDVLIGLAILEGVYLLFSGPLRERYKISTEPDSGKVAIFTAGVITIFIALLSPIHELSDVYLFSAHMFQHILLALVAPPLLILGIPGWMIRPALKSKIILKIAKVVTHPIIAFSLFNIVFSLWHIPSLYNLSVTNHSIHVIEHLLFIATAVLMWWPLTSNMSELPRLVYPLRVIYLFLLSIAQIIVFAPVTFSRQPLYEWYMDAPRIWGVSVLSDQQIGGIIMKVGSGVLFLTLAIIIFLRWFSEQEQKQDSEFNADPAQTT